MPPVAVLAEVNDTTLAVLDQVKDVPSAEAVPIHGPRPVPVHDDIGIPNQSPQLLLVFLLGQVQMAVPLAPVEIGVQRGHVRDVGRRDTHDARAHLGEVAGDDGRRDDAGQVDDLQAGEGPLGRGGELVVLGPPGGGLRRLFVPVDLEEADLAVCLALLAREVLVRGHGDCSGLLGLLVQELVEVLRVHLGNDLLDPLEDGVVGVVCSAVLGQAQGLEGRVGVDASCCVARLSAGFTTNRSAKSYERRLTMNLVASAILRLVHVGDKRSVEARCGPVLVRLGEHLHCLGHEVHERHGRELAVFADELSNQG